MKMGGVRFLESVIAARSSYYSMLQGRPETRGALTI